MQSPSEGARTLPSKSHRAYAALVGMQEVYDSLKGADMGDELYVEGMDDAFLEWRAQHGQEWARYYGLTVSRPLPGLQRFHSCKAVEAYPDAAGFSLRSPGARCT